MKDKIIAEYQPDRITKKKKRFRAIEHPQIDQVLIDWFRNLCENKIKVCGPIVLEKANQFAAMFNITEFQCSNSWI